MAAEPVCFKVKANIDIRNGAHDYNDLDFDKYFDQAEEESDGEE